MKKKQEEEKISILIKMEKSLHSALKKEAEAGGLPLVVYIRHMLITDPRRAKKPK